MKQVAFILLTLILLVGCSSNSDDGIVKTMATYLTTPNEEATTIAESETDTNINEETSYTTENTTTSDTQAKSLELFEAVYVPYVSRERPCSFDGVRNFAEVNNYKFEVVEPINNETPGKITFYNENEDYVYFEFLLIDNIETTMTINFYQGSKNIEVTRNNFSNYESPSADIYFTHVVGELQKQVNDIDEQREFLFN